MFPPSSSVLRGLYDESYDLGLRDRKAAQERAENYALQLDGYLPRAGGGKLVELGCGAGNLLNLLAGRLDCELAVGVEPSERLASAASGVGLSNVQIYHAFAEDYAEGAEACFDLCLSVNVAEHALDPAAFLAVCRKLISPEGIVIVVCPDGEQPGSELLFYDHISSFTRRSLAVFAQKSGLALVDSRPLTGPLSGFRVHVLRIGQSRHDRDGDYLGLAAARANYLARWQGCEREVQEVVTSRGYAIFGVGEFTNLVGAYCPSIVDAAVYFVADDPALKEVHGKEVVSSDQYLSSPDVDLLAAVNERSWAPVLARFSSLGVNVAHPFDLASWSSKHGRR